MARKSRCKITEFSDYLGYNASKDEYFYGEKVQMIVDQGGVPVEIFLHPGSYHDTIALSEMRFSLPSGSELFADKGYNWESAENKLIHEKNIKPMFLYKKNLKRRDSDEKIIAEKQKKRKPIETVFSLITRLFPKKIHAINLEGMERKIRIFILAYSFGKYIKSMLLI